MGRVYQPLKNQEELREQLGVYPKKRIDHPVIVHSYSHFAGEVGFPTDNHFGDEDNLRKAILDALVHAEILADDRYVIGGENYKLFAEEPYLLVRIYEF